MPEQVFEAALPSRAPIEVQGRETVAELHLGDSTRFAHSPVVVHDHDQRLCPLESTQVQASRNVQLDSVSREQGDDAALRAYRGLTFASERTFKVKRFKSLVVRDTAHQDIARATRTEDDPLWGHNQTGSKPIFGC
jgi:hypothetical protein